MIIKSISLSKSKTIGIMTADSRTRFRKIQITASCDLNDTDLPADAYIELSKFIEAQFNYEKEIK